MPNRSEINKSHVITGTPSEQEQFTFDPTGNWPTYVVHQHGTMTIDQTRAFQKANEITSISGWSGGVGYDANGNMTTMPAVDGWFATQTLTWDAWNRPITVKQGGSGTTLGTYRYDGLNRRTWKQSEESGTLTTRHFYYSNQWQVVEERTGSSASADTQYVWGTRYRDDLVLRDRAVGGSNERFYALADYFQTTSLVNPAGEIEQRFVYRAFGDVESYPAMEISSSSSSFLNNDFAWTYLYGGYQLDLETGLYQVRNRYYHTSLGRWLSRDPLKGAERKQGANLYWYVANNAVNAVDPTGLLFDNLNLTLNDSSYAPQSCPTVQNPGPPPGPPTPAFAAPDLADGYSLNNPPPPVDWSSSNSSSNSDLTGGYSLDNPPPYGINSYDQALDPSAIGNASNLPLNPNTDRSDGSASDPFISHYGGSWDPNQDSNSNGAIPIGNTNNALNSNSVAVSSNVAIANGLQPGDPVYINGTYVGNYDDTAPETNTIDVYDPGNAVANSKWGGTVNGGASITNRP